MRARGSHRAPASAPALTTRWSCAQSETFGNFQVDAGQRVLMDGIGRKSEVVAIDLASGRRLWTYPLGGQLLLAQAGLAVIHVGQDETHVVDCATGRPRLSLWSRVLFHPPTPALQALRGGRLVLVGGHVDNGTPVVRCFDVASGGRLWTHWPECVNQIAFSDSHAVILQSDASLVGIDLVNGRVAWRDDWRSCRWLEACGSRVYAWGAKDEARASLAALDSATGRVEWTTPYPVRHVSPHELLARDEACVVAVCPSTGERLADAGVQLTLPSRVPQPGSLLLASDRHLVFSAWERGGDWTTALLGVDRSTGRATWTHRPAEAGPVGDVAFAVDGRIVYRNGRVVYCLEVPLL